MWAAGLVGPFCVYLPLFYKKFQYRIFSIIGVLRKSCYGPFEVTKVADKIISVTYGFNVKQFTLSAVLPMPTKTNALELQDQIAKLSCFVTETQDLRRPMEFLHQSDPKYNYKAINDAVEQ